MDADTLTMLFREGDVEANDDFQLQFSPSCNFSKVVSEFDDSACSLVRKIFILDELVSLRVVNAAPCRSVSHVDRGWWASFSAQCCCRGWASFSAHFWTSGIYFYVYYDGYSNNQNHCSKS